MPSDPNALGASARQYLYGARAGLRFTFGGELNPRAVGQLLNSGSIVAVTPDDEWYVPGMYQWTDKGADLGRALPHHYETIPSPKMDAPDLVAARCICGYQSGPTTEGQARHRGNAHVNAKAQAAR